MGPKFEIRATIAALHFFCAVKRQSMVPPSLVPSPPPLCRQSMAPPRHTCSSVALCTGLESNSSTMTHEYPAPARQNATDTAFWHSALKGASSRRANSCLLVKGDTRK